MLLIFLILVVVGAAVNLGDSESIFKSRPEAGSTSTLRVRLVALDALVRAPEIIERFDLVAVVTTAGD